MTSGRTMQAAITGTSVKLSFKYLVSDGASRMGREALTSTFIGTNFWLSEFKLEAHKRGVSESVEGGFFLKEKPLSSAGLSQRQLEKRSRSRHPPRREILLTAAKIPGRAGLAFLTGQPAQMQYTCIDHSQMEIDYAADCSRPNAYALLLIKYKGLVGIFLLEPHCEDGGNSKIQPVAKLTTRESYDADQVCKCRHEDHKPLLLAQFAYVLNRSDASANRFKSHREWRLRLPGRSGNRDAWPDITP
jgi:hypothetical protein